MLPPGADWGARPISFFPRRASRPASRVGSGRAARSGPLPGPPEGLFETRFARSPMSLNPPGPAAAPTPRSLSMAVVVAAILIVAGLSVGATAAYFELRPTTTGPSPNNSVQVTDDTGRTVTASQNAGRVVVLSPSIMDIAFRLGLRDRVVAVGCTPSIQGGILNEYSPNQTSLWGLSNASCVTDYPQL